MGSNITLRGEFEAPVKVKAPFTVNAPRGADDVFVNSDNLRQLIERLSGGTPANARDRLVCYEDHAVQTTPDGIEKYYYDGGFLEIVQRFVQEGRLDEIGEFMLGADCSMPRALTVSADMVLDLNNHVMTAQPRSWAMHVTGGAKVVVKNGSVNAGLYGFHLDDGTLVFKDLQLNLTSTSTESSRGVNVTVNGNGNWRAEPLFIMDRNSSITVNGGANGGEIPVFLAALYSRDLPEGQDPSQCKSPCAIINGSITVNSGTADVNKYSYGLCDNGSPSCARVVWVVNDGARISVSNGVGIHRAADGELVLNGGKITGTTTGVVCRAGRLYVPSYSTVEVRGTGEHIPYDCGHFGGLGAADFSMGDAVSLEKNSAYSDGNLEAQIDGGTFISENGEPIGSYRHTKAQYAAFYTQEDLDSGTRLSNGELGEVGKLYAILAGMWGSSRSDWVWDSTVITGDDANFQERVVGFADPDGVTLNKQPSSAGYVNLTGENSSNGIFA